MGKISQYTQALKAKLTDLFVVAQDDNGTLTTKSVSGSQLVELVQDNTTASDLPLNSTVGAPTTAQAIGNISDLTTSNKSSLVGAVNELQYHIGDSIALNNLFVGYISSSSKRVRFTIPLDKPLDSNITGINFASTGDMTLYGASGADTIASPALTGWTFSLTRGSLFIQYDSSTAVTFPNQSMCAVFFSTSGSKITFT